MTTNPPTQYADDANLRNRQALWAFQDPPFDLYAWVLDIAAVAPGMDVLDVGCGNGRYLQAMADQGVSAIGCDLSLGMLHAARQHAALANADVTSLPLGTDAFDVVLAPHMLYHVPDRAAAARELRRVLRPDGVCVAVTNGARHVRELRVLVEAAARTTNPTWEMRNPSTHEFSLDNGGAQLATAFASVTCVRPEGVGPIVVRDAQIVADYVASVADHYEQEVDQPWSAIVDQVRVAVQRIIDTDGAFVARGDAGVLVCR